jgi:hypothetical protein
VRRFRRVLGVGMAVAAVCAATPREAVAQSAQYEKPLAAAIAAAANKAWAPAASASAAAQQTPANPDAGVLNFFRSTEFGGLVDVHYHWYSTKTPGIYRNFDVAHNQFTVSMAQLWLAKAPTEDSKVGFKAKLNFGPAARMIHFAEPDSPLLWVQEAYASYMASPKVTFDAGVWVTPHGAEVIEAKDNWNYTRSILFAWAIPYYHSGVRMNYTANDKVALQLNVSNGWNNAFENNTGKTFGLMLTLKPSGKVSFIQNYMVGPEQAGTNDEIRHLYDATVSYAANDKLSLMLNYDFAKDSVEGAGVNWQGVAGYLKYQANDKFAVVPRVEWFKDRDGFATGTAQNLKEFTLTLELKPASNFWWRIEYRGDYSDQAVFETDSGSFEKNQHSIGFGLIYAFSTKQ